MPKGCKTCKHCGATTGPRAYSCPKCDKPFDIKHKTKDGAIKAKASKVRMRKAKKVDWTTLGKGDIIKVVAGTGPIFETHEGYTVPTGYSGYFRVGYLGKDGIHAYPAKKSEARRSGHCYVYMGAERRLDFGSILIPHKIKLVKKAENELAKV